MKNDPGDKKVQLPRKRPRQSRGRFTVQTIYDGFLELWQQGGASAVSTRAIAEITGYSVGAIYEYFPNSQAILSGYVRYLMDDLIQRIIADSRQNISAPWPHRLRQLLILSLGLDADAKYFDRGMMLEEASIANPRHHEQAFHHLLEAWKIHIHSWQGLPRQPEDSTVESLFVATWGARRYMLLTGKENSDIIARIDDFQLMAEALLGAQPNTERPYP